MGTINRRDMVLGVGAAAGLAALGRAQASVPGIEADASAADVLRRIRLTGEAEQSFLARAGQGSCPSAPLPATAAARPQQAVEATVVMKTDAQGRPIAQGLSFACDPRVVNRLTVAGRPLVARRFCYSAGAILWSPGHGLPVYDSYCPRFDYGEGAYRDAKWHQVVPIIAGQAYYTGCQASDVCEAAQAGPVAFDVNDSHYDDNRGSYTVTLWSWS